MLDDQSIAPSCFSFARFGIASLIASPYTPSINTSKDKMEEDSFERICRETSHSDGNIWRWGLEMGFWMLLGYSFQAIGLEYTTAQRSGFLLYLNVKFVPFFAKFIFGRSISAATWISAATALTGTALLSYDGSPPNVGDFWSILAAASSAMFIIRLEAANRSIRKDQSSSLNSACLWVVTTGCFLWSLLTVDEIVASDSAHLFPPLAQLSLKVLTQSAEIFVHHPWEMLYLGGVTTALANFIQTRGQRGITAEKASIIYAMDPVFGAIFAYLILGESLGIKGVFGASLITIAAATTAYLDFNKQTANESNRYDQTCA